MDHQDLLETLDSQDRKEIRVLQVRWDPPVHQVQLDRLETPDMAATVDFKVLLDLLDH